jgi:hypothetical protein
MTPQFVQTLLIMGTIFPEAIFEHMLIPLYPFLTANLLAQSGDASKARVDFYTGVLGSCFSLPLFIMNLVWGTR